MNPLAQAAFILMRAYAAITPTERGGFRLARLARRAVPRSQWQGTFDCSQGLKLSLDLGIYPDVAMAFGIYELDSIRQLRQLIPPGGHFVDCGANIGYFTLLAAKVAGPRGRVDAYEPDPLNRVRLEEHLRLNGLGDTVRVHPLGVAETAGRTTLYHPTGIENHGQASIFSELVSNGQAMEVDLVRLDEHLDHAPNLIKLDIEGAEISAIRGMSRLLAGPKPPALIIEHNLLTLQAAGHTCHDLFDALLGPQPGYRVYWIGTRLWRLKTAADLQRVGRQGNLLVTVD